MMAREDETMMTQETREERIAKVWNTELRGTLVELPTSATGPGTGVGNRGRVESATLLEHEGRQYVSVDVRRADGALVSREPHELRKVNA